MSKVRFLQSALDGKTVTLSATQGGVTVGPNTISAWGVSMPGAAWNGPSPASLTVTVDEVLPVGDLFAPLPVEWRIRVEGTSYATPDWLQTSIPAPYEPITKEQEDAIRLGWEAHDPSFQRCHFVVHTGDTGTYRNEWVGSPAHRNKAFEYGQNCGHVYAEPGEYARSVYVYDDEGNWGTLSLPPLVVVDPDWVFDAASTLVVDPDADPSVADDWSAAPAHNPANRFTTLDGAIRQFQAHKAAVFIAKGMRICIRAGATLSERARQMDTGGAKGPCLVDTYGGAARFSYSERNLDAVVPRPPNSDRALFRINTGAWAVRIRDGTFDMGYDATNGHPTNTSGFGDRTTLSRSFLHMLEPVNIYDPVRRTDPNARVTLHNSDVQGCGWFVFAGNGNVGIRAKAPAIFVSDCDFWNNADYLFFQPPNLFAMGVRMRDLGRTDLGMNGRGRVCGLSRGWRGHPIFVREKNCWTMYVRATYMECRGGWSGQGGRTGHLGSQPIMRLNSGRGASDVSGWVNGRGRRYYVCDSVIAGSVDNVDGDATSSGPAAAPVRGSHMVFENCLLVHDPQGNARGVLPSVGGRNSVRNCIYLVLDTPPFKADRSFPNRDASRFEVPGWAGRFRFFLRTPNTNAFLEGARLENRHNTFVLLRNEADIQDGAYSIRENRTMDFDARHDIVEGHNVLHAPRLREPEGVADMTKIDLPSGMRILNPWIKTAWERAEFVLASPVAHGAETPAIRYPVDWYREATTGADYAGGANVNAITFEDAETRRQRWYDTVLDYPNSNGVQTSGVPDAMSIIHDCDAAGVVRGDGTGTHFKVLNRSGGTWRRGLYTVILDRGSTSMEAEEIATIDAEDFKLYRPRSAQPLDEGLGSTLFDFDRRLRPGAGFAISPRAGTNAAGALLAIP